MKRLTLTIATICLTSVFTTVTANHSVPIGIPLLHPFATIACDTDPGYLAVPTPTGYGLKPNWAKVEGYQTSGAIYDAQRYLWNRHKWYDWQRLSTVRSYTARTYEPDLFLRVNAQEEAWMNDEEVTYFWSNMIGAYLDDRLFDDDMNMTVGSAYSGTFIPWQEYWSLIETPTTSVASSNYLYRSQRGQRWPNHSYCTNGSCIWSCNNGPNGLILHDSYKMPGCVESVHFVIGSNSQGPILGDVRTNYQGGPCP